MIGYPYANTVCELAKSLPSMSDSDLYNPMDCSLPGSSVREILQARLLEWVAMPSSRTHAQCKLAV